MDALPVDPELVTYPIPASHGVYEEIRRNPQETLEKICAHVAEGGDVVSWCKARNLMYWAIESWLHEDEDRYRRWQQALDARAEWTRQRVLSTLHSLAFFDISDAYNADGSVKPFTEWSESAKRAIAEIRVDEMFAGKGDERTQVGLTKKIKFTDKLKAVELLMKFHNMLTERIVVDQTLAVSPKLVDKLKLLPDATLTDIILGRTDVKPE